MAKQEYQKSLKKAKDTYYILLGGSSGLCALEAELVMQFIVLMQYL